MSMIYVVRFWQVGLLCLAGCGSSATSDRRDFNEQQSNQSSLGITRSSGTIVVNEDAAEFVRGNFRAMASKMAADTSYQQSEARRAQAVYKVRVARGSYDLYVVWPAASDKARRVEVSASQGRRALLRQSINQRTQPGGPRAIEFEGLTWRHLGDIRTIPGELAIHIRKRFGRGGLAVDAMLLIPQGETPLEPSPAPSPEPEPEPSPSMPEAAQASAKTFTNPQCQGRWLNVGDGLRGGVEEGFCRSQGYRYGGVSATTVLASAAWYSHTRERGWFGNANGTRIQVVNSIECREPLSAPAPVSGFNPCAPASLSEAQPNPDANTPPPLPPVIVTPPAPNDRRPWSSAVGPAWSTWGDQRYVIDFGRPGYSERGDQWRHTADVTTVTKPYGGDARYVDKDRKGHRAVYTQSDLTAGGYTIYMTWTKNFNRATNTLVRVFDGNQEIRRVRVNQRDLPNGFGWQDRLWLPLGSFDITNGQVRVEIGGDDLDGVAVADAVVITNDWLTDVRPYPANPTCDNLALSDPLGDSKVAMDQQGRVLWIDSYSDRRITVKRFLPGLVPDPNFGLNGAVTLDVGPAREVATAITSDANGAVYIAGHYEVVGIDNFMEGDGYLFVAKLAADGRPDLSFGNTPDRSNGRASRPGIVSYRLANSRASLSTGSSASMGFYGQVDDMLVGPIGRIFLVSSQYALGWNGHFDVLRPDGTNLFSQTFNRLTNSSISHESFDHVTFSDRCRVKLAGQVRRGEGGAKPQTFIHQYGVSMDPALDFMITKATPAGVSDTTVFDQKLPYAGLLAAIGRPQNFIDRVANIAPPVGNSAGALTTGYGLPGYEEVGANFNNGQGDYRFYRKANWQNTASYHFSELAAGRYDVFLYYTAHDNRATNVPVQIVGSATQTVSVNQQRDPDDHESGGKHYYRLATATAVNGQITVSIGGSRVDGTVILGEVRLVPR